MIRVKSAKPCEMAVHVRLERDHGDAVVYLCDAVEIHGQPARVIETLILAAQEVARSAGLPPPVQPPF